MHKCSEQYDSGGDIELDLIRLTPLKLRSETNHEKAVFHKFRYNTGSVSNCQHSASIHYGYAQIYRSTDLRETQRC